LQKQLKSWETLHYWQYEPSYKTVRPDAFVTIKNNTRDAFRFLFVERECDTNPFRKIQLYNEMYEKGEYTGSWWAEKATRFPVTMIVVETTARLATVRKCIEKENKHGLEFKAYLMDQIISEVKGVNICLK
jgi:hypothetical protein